MHTSAAELDKAIGNALRGVRLSRTYTQAELAEVLGVTRTAVTHYESGNRPLSATQLVQAALALECPAHQLLPPIPGLAPTAPSEPSQAPPGAVGQIVQILARRPDLIPNVLDLLETMLELSDADEQEESES